MNRERFYKIVILCLLLLNFGILGYLLVSRNDGHGHPPPGGPPDRLIIERLKLDEKQQDTFDGLKQEHHGQMMELQEQSSILHRQLYALLKNKPVDSATKDSLMQLLQQNALQKEQVTFEHFRKLRGILRPEQEPAFDDLVEEISQRIMGPHRSGH